MPNDNPEPNADRYRNITSSSCNRGRQAASNKQPCGTERAHGGASSEPTSGHARPEPGAGARDWQSRTQPVGSMVVCITNTTAATWLVSALALAMLELWKRSWSWRRVWQTRAGGCSVLEARSACWRHSRLSVCDSEDPKPPHTTVTETAPVDL